MRARVEAAIVASVGTHQNGSLLEVSRNVLAYVLAADIIGYRSAWYDNWVDWIRVMPIEQRTMISQHEERPNNHGTHAGVARIAIARYLGDDVEVARAAEVFHGWVGNRDVYQGFSFGDLEGFRLVASARAAPREFAGSEARPSRNRCARRSPWGPTRAPRTGQPSPTRAVAGLRGSSSRPRAAAG